MQPSIEERLAQILKTQKAVDEAYASIEHEFPEAWAKLKAIEQAREMAEQAKQEIREELIAAKDFSTRQVEGYNISVSRTVKLAVIDQDKVSADYKKTEEVVDIKKAQEYMKVMDKVPAGFEDRSVYRFNWKEVKNA